MQPHSLPPSLPLSPARTELRGTHVQNHMDEKPEDRQHSGSPQYASKAPVSMAMATSQCLTSTGASASDSIASAVSFDLVVLVLSSEQKQLQPSRRREAVRRSWVRDLTSSPLGAPGAGASALCSVAHYFVVGGGTHSAHVREGAGAEAGDVLVLPVADGYQQIVHKVIGALRWLVASVAFKFVLKTDDDSFVCAARLFELLRTTPRARAYVGVANTHHKVITDDAPTRYERWRDPEYVALFNRTVYAPYMQGAGYLLSADLAAVVVRRAAALRTLPSVEDALVGALAQPDALHISRRTAFRHKNRDDYAVTVCELDTEFVLLHKLTEEDLARCHDATQRRRSERCPRGPCTCRSLGLKLRRPKKLFASFEDAAKAHAARQARAANATRAKH